MQKLQHLKITVPVAGNIKATQIDIKYLYTTYLSLLNLQVYLLVQKYNKE